MEFSRQYYASRKSDLMHAIDAIARCSPRSNGRALLQTRAVTAVWPAWRGRDVRRTSFLCVMSASVPANVSRIASDAWKSRFQQ